MGQKRVFIRCGVLAVGVALLIGPSLSGQTTAPSMDVAHSQNTKRIARYDVVELTFRHDRAYADPYLDVSVEVTFTSPAGRATKVGGFLYGSTAGPRRRDEPPKRGGWGWYMHDRPNVWKARLAPWETGTWRYTYVFTNADGQRATGEGSFECVTGKRPSRGFVRQHPANPYRWVFDDGSAYFPIGLQDCWADSSGTGSVLDTISMEGPYRPDRDFELPPGPMFVRGPSNNPQNADVYFRAFSQAGFDLYRFSQRNCSYPVYGDLDEILLQEAIMADELLEYARKYGLRMLYGLLGNTRVLEAPPLPDNPMTLVRVKRFIKYSVDRWAAMVDFWELLNEKTAHEDWLTILVPYIRSIDPYKHPISTNWQRPDFEGIDINTPHWFHRVDTILDSDEVTVARAREYKKYGKPVIVAEHGNNITVLKSTDRPIPFEMEHYEIDEIDGLRKAGKLPPGAGGTWDPASALRMRIRNWTALFQEIAFIYWNNSYARDGHPWNMWLGPLEREYIRAMQDFAYRLDPDVRMTSVTVSDPQSVRAYGLASSARAAVYLHHYRDHAAMVNDLTITVEIPKACDGYWYDPATAGIVRRIDVASGKQTLGVPGFKVDMALLVTPDGPPDADGDGTANDLDADDDNDGVEDTKDAYPLDPSEWADRDGDLIGDNLDADDDADGKGDDADGDGAPDRDNPDPDGDGVPTARSVLFDAFPLDAAEQRDTDGDGIGDNADSDDDGDGYSDQDEIRMGTDPSSCVDFP